MMNTLTHLRRRCARPLSALLLAGGMTIPGTGMAEVASATRSPEIRAHGSPSTALSESGPGLRDALQPFDAKQLTRARPEQPQSRSSTAMAKSGHAAAKHCCAFRVYDAHTRLYDDRDLDGYYSYLQLDFDVDTDFEVADIYADIWLIDSYGDETLLFATEVFTIYGHSGIDDYRVEAELVAGFDSDLYDVLIEVFDAYDESLVAHHGARESSAMSLLPMESVHQDSWRREVHAHGDGGSLGVGWLILMLAFVGARRHATPGMRAIKTN